MNNFLLVMNYSLIPICLIVIGLCVAIFLFSCLRNRRIKQTMDEIEQNKAREALRKSYKHDDPLIRNRNEYD